MLNKIYAIANMNVCQAISRRKEYFCANHAHVKISCHIGSV